MKAFVLAAGHGTRLRPLTDTMPKCLVPVRGVPILKIWLDLCRRHGVDDVLVNLHSHADQVQEFLSRENDGITVRIFEEEKLLGSAGTLLANRSWVESDECFWVFYADVLTNVDLGRMLHFHRSHGGSATLGVYTVPDPSRCGVITVDSGNVVRDFVEKPQHPTGNVVFSGILLGTPAMLQAIPDTGEADIARDLLPNLVGRMYAYTISEFLLDIGTMHNYQVAQREWPGIAAAQESIAGTKTCSEA
ncbi:MAG: nucleotidyltransferase family protein [Terriglobales bacterium]